MADFPQVRRAPLSRTPSVNFLLIVLVFTGIGAALWHGYVGGKAAVFVFVIAGWVVSLCLHEFGHAITAYWGGDRRIVETGYLSLDPLKYTDPALSLLLPLILIFLGGIGLPGGAVWVRTGALRSKAWMSAVSAAGPLANGVCLGLLGLLFAAMPHGDQPSDVEAGVAVLAFFQATAIVLNLLPLPGLDGFGIVRPWLPVHIAVKANQVGAATFLILLLLLWYTPLGRVIFTIGFYGADLVGIDVSAVVRGILMVRLR
jgi:Zn-dependent protease